MRDKALREFIGTRRLMNTVTTPMLLRIVQSGRLNAKKLVSHRFDNRKS